MVWVLAGLGLIVILGLYALAFSLATLAKKETPGLSGRKRQLTICKDVRSRLRRRET